MSKPYSVRPRARPTGPAWDRHVETSRRRRDNRDRPSAYPAQTAAMDAAGAKNVTTTGGIFSAASELWSLAKSATGAAAFAQAMFKPTAAADGTMSSDPAVRAMQNSWNSYEVYKSSREAAALAAGAQIDLNPKGFDLRLPDINTPTLPPQVLWGDTSPPRATGNYPQSESEPGTAPAVFAGDSRTPLPQVFPGDDQIALQQKLGTKSRPSAKQAEKLAAAGLGVRPVARPQEGVDYRTIVYVTANAGRYGLSLSQSATLSGRPQAKEREKKEKGSKAVQRVQRVISKTFGTYTEVMDFYGVFAWSIYGLNKAGEPVPALSLVGGNHQSLLEGLLTGEFKLDLIGFTQGYALMQANDSFFASVGQSQQAGASAMGYDAPFGIQQMSNLGQRSAQASLDYETKEQIDGLSTNLSLASAVRSVSDPQTIEGSLADKNARLAWLFS